MKYLALLLLPLLPVTATADEPVARPGALLLEDHFERADLGDWKVIIPAFSVEDGALKGSQGREDHGGVGRIYVPMKDVVAEFRFQLRGSPGFNAVFDDKNHKGSHAGHICRVAFAPSQIRIGDDKEGIMRNDIFEMRRDPARKAEADAQIQDRSTSAPVKLQQETWYQVRLELAGDRLRVLLDGEPIATLQSPGIAHPTKTSLHFTVNGPGVLFDDVKIWEAAP
ncbi:MAG: hypothetical protein KDK99_13395 [Verrucomicrobiales bacterium]|nr:hypothetical protein [Verrucomicrobiales bacterium]